MRQASFCACSSASASSVSQRARSSAVVSIGPRLTRAPPSISSHYGEQVDVSLAFGPLWSRNRLTFLRNERYQAMLGPHLLPGSGLGDSIMTETDFPYLDVPPLLVAGSSDGAIERARRTAQAFGIRLGHAMRIDDVRGRLERQA